MKIRPTIFFLALSLVLSTRSFLVAQDYIEYAGLDPYSGSPTLQKRQQKPSPRFSNPLNEDSGKEDLSLYPTYVELSEKGSYEYADGSYESISGGSHRGELLLYYAYRDFNRFEAASGFGVALKVNLMETLYLRATYDRVLSGGARDTRISGNSLGMGLGLELPVYEALFLFGEIGVRYDHLQKRTPQWESGFQAVGTLGLRWQPTEKLDISAAITADSSDFNTYRLEVNGFYSILPIFDVGAGLDWGEDYRSYKVGGRVKW